MHRASSFFDVTRKQNGITRSWWEAYRAILQRSGLILMCFGAACMLRNREIVDGWWLRCRARGLPVGWGSLRQEVCHGSLYISFDCLRITPWPFVPKSRFEGATSRSFTDLQIHLEDLHELPSPSFLSFSFPYMKRWFIAFPYIVSFIRHAPCRANACSSPGRNAS
jgi:hypothetical protein